MAKKKSDPKLDNKGDAGFVDTDLGSATVVNLDGASESEGFVTEEGVQYVDKAVDGYASRGAPWGRQESLQYLTEEVGINFDDFIDALAQEKSDEDMADSFGVTVKTIKHFREHFETKGIDSVMGQD